MASFSGRVKKQVIARGSRSEREAVVLETHDGGMLVLRRPGGNAFDDPDLDALVGKELTAEGRLLGRELFLSNFDVS